MRPCINFINVITHCIRLVSRDGIAPSVEPYESPLKTTLREIGREVYVAVAIGVHEAPAIALVAGFDTSFVLLS